MIGTFLMFEQVLIQQQKRQEIQNQRMLERATEVLLTSTEYGIYFQDESANYLIRVPFKFGFRVAPIKMN